MFTWLHEHVIASGPQLNVGQTLLTLFFSSLYAYIIALNYRRTYQGKEYNVNFAHSVVLLGSLVSLVIAIIGNSIARAFGVFGALAIIRYRVPIRDPKDIVYVLASVVIGLACGVQEYPEAGLATLFFVGLAQVLYRFPMGLQPTAEQTAALVEDKEHNGDKDEKHKHKHKHRNHDDDDDDL